MLFNKADITDWLVMAVVTDIIVAATAFLFMHPEPVNFATWAGVVSTITGVYHWLLIRDSKQADA